MKITKDTYWEYSLIILILVLGIVLFKEFLPFLSGFLGACTIYILVRKQMVFLSEKKKLRKSIAASLILFEVLICFLVPTFLVIWLMLYKIQSIDLAPKPLIDSVQHFVSSIKNKTGYDLLSTDNLSTITSYISEIVKMILNQVSSFTMNSLVLLFILYFMLIGNRQMESYIYEILPFSYKNKKNVLNEINMMVKSNAIGIPLLAVIQGGIAVVGYIIFGVHDPILFGFLTCFATIIPLIGTALIWFPLVLHLGLTGDWASAIGLSVYSLVIISNIDNFVRLMLQKKMADTHPLITVFGVIIGLTLFGFWGVIFGPLLLSMFALCFNILKKEYLEK